MSTINGTIAHTITLASTGIYGSPLTISDTGYGGTAIFEPNTQAWSIVNYGTVDGAINFLKGSSVTNASGGAISGGGASGVNIAGGIGTVSNADVISGFVGVDLYAGGSIISAASGFIGGSGFTLSRSIRVPEPSPISVRFRAMVAAPNWAAAVLWLIQAARFTAAMRASGSTMAARSRIRPGRSLAGAMESTSAPGQVPVW